MANQQPVPFSFAGRHSDGDPNRRPASNSYTLATEQELSSFLEEVNKHIQGYNIADLPANYAVFVKPHKQDEPEGAKDKYVFGHRGGSFNSVKKFSVHIQAMLDNNPRCPCVNCPTVPATAPPANQAPAPGPGPGTGGGPAGGAGAGAGFGLAPGQGYVPAYNPGGYYGPAPGYGSGPAYYGPALGT